MTEILSGLIDIELRQGGQTLTRQLYQQLRAAILKGSLPPGHRLPSSRDLARQLNVSRNTVSLVVDQLAMEGYLAIARGKRPTVAAAGTAALVSGRAPPRRPRAGLRVSRWAERLRKSAWPIIHAGEPRPFLPGFADARAFPHDIWARCLRRAAREARVSDPAALNRRALQAALLRHLVEHRGVRAQARQIIITPSAQSSIELIARVLLDPG
ncbi:MAG TPA: GntR family transcriptional regulator, partial [Bradyrhizobium sp.]|nr:GntR family transcriptional regulator [Bradyrhizobium sp.]